MYLLRVQKNINSGMKINKTTILDKNNLVEVPRLLQTTHSNDLEAFWLSAFH